MKWNRFLLYLVLALGVLMAVYPFVWMVGTAFKTLPEANTASLRLFPDTWQWGNVAATFRAAPFGRYFLNSLLVSMIVCVSVCLTSLMAGYAFARLRFRGRGVLFTAGIHPSSQSDDAKLGRLSAFLDDSLAGDGADLLLGVGETGLDFYRMRQPRDAQERSFEFQLGAAKRRGLPVIVHIRDAMDEGIAIMTRFAPLTGIMHCFSGDSAAARRVIDLGLLVSFAGNLTYPKATQLHDAARYVPLDRLLLETDAPFLTPVPYRGKPNRPAFVTHTYAFFATMRKEPLANVIDTIEQNFDTLIAGRRG